MLSDRRPVLSVCYVGVLWPKGWTNQDETRHAGRPRPWPYCVRLGRHIVLDWDPALPAHTVPPNFQPISVVAK